MIFENAYVHVLSILGFLDHHMILISPHGELNRSMLKQFLFESMWLLKTTYDEKLRSIWNEGGSLVNNLDHHREHLLYWNMQTIYGVMEMK